MYQHALPTSQRHVNIITRSLEVRFDIDHGLIKYVNAVAAEAIPFGAREPRCLDDLNEMGDVMLAQKVAVVDHGHGADVEHAH
jgi:hypothetical protein